MKVNIHSNIPQYKYKFEVPDTGIIGVYGISGSGKSSLLDSIAGFQDKVEGRIDYLDKKLANVIKCSYLQQHPILFPHWTVEQNLEFARKYSNNDKEKLTDLVQQLDCQNLLHKQLSQLSGGELQRIAYIRALIQINNKHIVLLDEPYSALDKKLANRALQLLYQYKKHNLIFLVTHKISELYQIADELLYIDNSEVIFHQSIEGAMCSGYKRLPIASRINIAGEIHVIYANDVSISLSKHSDSSIINQLSVTILTIEKNINSVILKIKTKHSNTLFAQITHDSLERLNLKVHQEVIANFKASPYQNI